MQHPQSIALSLLASTTIAIGCSDQDTAGVSLQYGSSHEAISTDASAKQPDSGAEQKDCAAPEPRLVLLNIDVEGSKVIVSATNTIDEQIDGQLQVSAFTGSGERYVPVDITLSKKETRSA